MIKRIFDIAEKLLFILIIEVLRPFVRHNLYLVASQMNMRILDPVDSWTFFRWLQDHDIPSRFIIEEDTSFYQGTLKGSDYKDIIVLPRDSGTGQILHHINLWIRARAFVVEWNMNNDTLDYWLKYLHGMRYVMLQHGITGLHISNLHIKGFQLFNDINVSSIKEQQIIESIPGVKPGTCFIGGMARYDNLKDLADHTSTEKYLFVMFTWRNFVKGTPQEDIEQSCYWQEIKKMLSDENLEHLAQKNVRVVMALHHSLHRYLHGVSTKPNVIIAEQEDIKYWISRAHGFLTDFSSVAFDFMFLSKPVVFWIPDRLDPTLNPKDVGYGDKVLSALENRKFFFNTADSTEEVMSLLEQYADNGFSLERDKQSIADQWFVYRDDISRHIYDGIEARVRCR